MFIGCVTVRRDEHSASGQRDRFADRQRSGRRELDTRSRDPDAQPMKRRSTLARTASISIGLPAAGASIRPC